MFKIFSVLLFFSLIFSSSLMGQIELSETNSSNQKNQDYKPITKDAVNQLGDQLIELSAAIWSLEKRQNIAMKKEIQNFREVKDINPSIPDFFLYKASGDEVENVYSITKKHYSEILKIYEFASEAFLKISK